MVKIYSETRTWHDNNIHWKFPVFTRSRDFNPIEYILYIIKIKLHQDALEQNIMYEDRDSFSARVYNPHHLLFLPKLLILVTR